MHELGIKEATPPQLEAIPRVLAGENVLLIAPTGSGKTEAALLPVLHQLIQIPQRIGISIIYITPLRALNRDMLKRLTQWSQHLNFTVEVRHGDTPQSKRRKQSLHPPDLLVTTPETLQAILPAGRLRQSLQWVRWIIVDEVHQLAGDRRGVQLTIGLERLRQITKTDFQRIGLSATVGNPNEVGAFLAGSNRKISVVRVEPPKASEFHVEMPKPSLEDDTLARKLYTSPEAAARLSRISSLVSSRVSTLIFVNARTTAEFLGSRLNSLRQDIGVHHGSLPKEERMRVEEAFKAGELKGLVCTSTLELGIDIGLVDSVLQYMSPRQVSALLQRVGRSGHTLHRTSEGTLIAVSAEDVLESVACVEQAKMKRLEPVVVHDGAMDVLAHQIAGILMDSEGAVSIAKMISVIREANPYRGITQDTLLKVTNFLEKLQLIRHDGETLYRTRRTRQYYFENLSMIPDERRYPVIDLATGQKVGILGEEFVVLRGHKGTHFIVKGRVWEIQEHSPDGFIYVTPIEDPTAAIPGWDGEILPLPYELAQRTAHLRGEIAALLAGDSKSSAARHLQETYPLDAYGSHKIVEELELQRSLGAPIPDQRTILVEGFDRFLILHMPFGDRVNHTFSELFEELMMREGIVRFWWSDGYRILYELNINTQDLNLNQIAEKLFKRPEEIYQGAFNSVLHRHFPWGLYLKHVAERFGALRRGLFLYADAMKELVLRFRLTPIYEETLREAKMLHIDLDRSWQILRDVKAGNIQLVTLKTRDKPSPLAYHLLYRHVDVPELIAPENVSTDNASRMRLALANETVNLLCFECHHLQEMLRVGELAEEPKCVKCGSGLLGVVFYSAGYLQSLLIRRGNSEKLIKEEAEALSRTRRSADLVLSYGKRAVIAQSVYGIGPQTAARILARMHDSDEDFYRDLLDAKLKFIQTRRFWDATARN